MQSLHEDLIQMPPLTNHRNKQTDVIKMVFFLFMTRLSKTFLLLDMKRTSDDLHDAKAHHHSK